MQGKKWGKLVFNDQESNTPTKRITSCPNPSPYEPGASLCDSSDPEKGTTWLDGCSIMGDSPEEGYPDGRHCPIGNCKSGNP